jgi:hypothetical protein
MNYIQSPWQGHYKDMGLTECEQTELLNQLKYDNSIVEYTSDEDNSKELTKSVTGRWQQTAKMATLLTFPQKSTNVKT